MEIEGGLPILIRPGDNLYQRLTGNIDLETYSGE
jgi:hypothetical protein